MFLEHLDPDRPTIIFNTELLISDSRIICLGGNLTKSGLYQDMCEKALTKSKLATGKILDIL